MTRALRAAARCALSSWAVGTPLPMIRVYTRVEWWHARAGHDGPAQDCLPCCWRLAGVVR